MVKKLGEDKEIQREVRKQEKPNEGMQRQHTSRLSDLLQKNETKRQDIGVN
jgi:hypothetical protein